MMLFLFACGGSQEEIAEEEIFNEGPVISLIVNNERPIETEPLSIQIDVFDSDGVANVIGYYRSSDSSYWNQVLLWEGRSSDTEQTLEVEKLIEKLENNDDVQNVYHTMSSSSE